MLNIEGRDEREWIRALGDVRRMRGFKSHRELAARPGRISFSFFPFFLLSSKGYSVSPTLGNLNIEIIWGLQGVTKLEEFQHMHRYADGTPVFRNPDVKGDRSDTAL